MYRLENKEGVGPFHTEQGEMAQELEPHTAPKELKVLHYAGLSEVSLITYQRQVLCLDGTVEIG